MKPLILLTLVLLTAGLAGQDTTYSAAIVELKYGEVLRGTLSGYQHNAPLRLVEVDGSVREIPWRKVRRITLSDSLPSAEEASPVFELPGDPAFVPPSRRWRHGVSTWIGSAAGVSQQDFSSGSFFTENERPVSTGVSYQLMRQRDRVAIGIGPGFEIMSARRKERLVSLSGLLEYRMGARRVQPLLRFRVGGSLPLGHSEAALDGRRISPLYHPSVGLHLSPAPGRWSTLSLDIGYRFTRLEATILTQNLEVVERRVQYRRLTFSLGTNF